jgi:putative tryptophan/tyrosine transport system substrate-binding protein
VSRVAVLFDPANEPYTSEALRELDAAARSLGVHILRLESRQPEDLEPAVSMAARRAAGALLVLGPALMTAHAARIGEAATRQRLPAMIYTDLITTGFVLSYGPSFAHHYQRAGYYIDKILRGAKPGDTPVEQPTTYQLVINLRTATTIGLTIPQAVLIWADRVIQ